MNKRMLRGFDDTRTEMNDQPPAAEITGPTSNDCYFIHESYKHNMIRELS